MLRLSYFSLIWKLCVIILIHKSNKPKNEPTSHKLISLLLVLSKLFGKVKNKSDPFSSPKKLYQIPNLGSEKTTPQFTRSTEL